jgi:acyl-CoA thioester hydrolase
MPWPASSARAIRESLDEDRFPVNAAEAPGCRRLAARQRCPDLITLSCAMNDDHSSTADAALPAFADGGIDARDRARFGIDPGWAFGHERLVEWRDVDGFRHANHTAFLLWFETERNRYLEAAGLPRHSPDVAGPVMMTLEARYLKPIAYHDPVFVTARVRSMRRTSFVMEYAAWGPGDCHATCTALLVLMINATGEKVAIPDRVRVAIRALDAPAEES